MFIVMNMKAGVSLITRLFLIDRLNDRKHSCLNMNLPYDCSFKSLDLAFKFYRVRLI